MKLYPTIVTTDRKHEDKLKEAQALGLREVCFFASSLNPQERKAFYPKLEESLISSIPFVHLCSDFEPWEVEFFLSRFKTKVFNCHSFRQYPINPQLIKYRKLIYLENGPTFPFRQDEVSQLAGLCVDFSHLQIIKYFCPFAYRNNMEFIKRAPIGCAHVSPTKKVYPYLPFLTVATNPHWLNSMSEMDYLLGYQDFFPEIMALEMENSLAKQLEVIDYLSSKFSWKLPS